MTLRTLLLSLTCLPCALAQQEGSLEWYLPLGVTYDPDFPKPDEVLGWEVGTWHVRHDQLVDWYRTVAAASPRVSLETYGHTYEQRPLLLAAVSSPANLERLEELRVAHVAAVKGGAEEHDGPQVIWMGYGVHGNESSGSNAALLFAYHLAAARGQEIEAFLEDTIVLIDPCVNPDGLSRFAHWANNNRGRLLVDSPLHRERREAWPGGRTNHYWFDLNRDWLLLTHPESRGRLAQFHRWMPSVLTDYHEMGSDSTYFFQPGIPTRQNPLTPQRNLELTRDIAGYHAEALDEIGSLYYTEESFDDFYYGKGSTYPDINLQENSYGGISFPFTIKNQLVTSLSTLRAAQGLADELTAYQRSFYLTAREEAARHPVRAYVLGAAEDPGRTHALVDILRRHDVQVHHLAEPVGEFEPAFAYVVATDQPQFRLVRAVFETRTSWPDNTFYDVSTWTLPLSFDVPTREVHLEDFDPAILGAPALEADPAPARVITAHAPVAWLFEWHHLAAPRHLSRLLNAGVRARVATRTFRAQTPRGERDYALGTIVVPTGVQDIEPRELRRLLEAAAADGLEITAATSGLTPNGVDLGSGSLAQLDAPRPALVVGSGVSAYEAGEVWHHLDQRLDVAVPLIERADLARLELDQVTHLLLVSGATSGWDDATRESIERWVRSGGVLIASKGAASWGAEELLPSREPPEEDDSEDDPAVEDLAYGDYEQLRAAQRVSGTIFEAGLDLTHPLCFGYVRDRLPVFRNSTAVLPPGTDPFATPVRYTAAPLLSGFASEENIARIAGTPAVRAERVGRGAVILLADDPLFRGVWYGTARLYANALFFGGTLKSTGPVDQPPARRGQDDAHQDGHDHDH
jgi:hypothetical protein